jgi:hypothetical protein
MLMLDGATLLFPDGSMTSGSRTLNIRFVPKKTNCTLFYSVDAGASACRHCRRN